MKSSWWWVAVLYLLVLIPSWVVMSTRQIPLPQSEDWKEIPVNESEQHSASLRYRKRLGTDASLTPVLLLHGSPMSSSGFAPLLATLGTERTVLIPDLPGFGKSRYGFTDFSFEGHAAAMEQLLMAENLSSIHLVAYSQGGGPGINLAHQHPNWIQSITLLASIGVQEEELTGDYFLNHLVHGVQLVLLEAVRWVIPHFGALDGSLLHINYAKNFYHGDMRPLRGYLEAYEGPMLIIQGTRDVLVRPEGAREHARIVPQSETVWLDGGHLLPLIQPKLVSQPMEAFWQKVEKGEATTRATADPTRLQSAALAMDPDATALTGISLWITLTVLAVATLASEDLTCISAGLFAARGLIPLAAAMISCLVGIWVGDMGLYLLGRTGGRWLVTRAPLKWIIKPEALEVSSSWLRRRGGVAIFISRFMPGTRLPLYFATGVVSYPIRAIMGWFLLAAILWAIPVVGLVAYFGETFSEWLLRSGPSVFPMAIGLLLLFWLLLRVVTQLSTHRGRRLALAAWLRWKRWEFWPPFVFYPPLAIAIIFMGLRRRCLFAFTAANPGIPHGGITGESKIDILQHLVGSGSVGRFLPIYPQLTGTDERVRLVDDWRSTEGIPFPLVVKPDVGERGRGVVIVRNEEALSAELRSRPDAFLVQEFLPGLEYGVFYLRYPMAERGEIFSITKKIHTSVKGDGIRSLHDLILDDSRAFLSHRHFFQIHRNRLEEIPSEGEEVTLAPLGSHCRGSLFLNGEELKSEALLDEVERIARHFDGFCFGRFDLKCPSDEDLRLGRGIRVIELNGVSSESTHIYHPYTPLHMGYSVLLRQWRHAFDIGLSNRNAGARVSTARELYALLGGAGTNDTR